jgi:hypothetical protein
MANRFSPYFERTGFKLWVGWHLLKQINVIERSEGSEIFKIFSYIDPSTALRMTGILSQIFLSKCH